MFQCMECGRRFRSVRAAERASNDGCPGCGSVDVDEAPEHEAARLDRLNRELIRDRLAWHQSNLKAARRQTGGAS